MFSLRSFALLELSSFGCVSQHVLSNVLDWVLWSVLSELLQSFNQLRHDVSVKVLSDWEVGVYWFFVLLVHVVHLSVHVIIEVYKQSSNH